MVFKIQAISKDFLQIYPLLSDEILCTKRSNRPSQLCYENWKQGPTLFWKVL